MNDIVTLPSLNPNFPNNPNPEVPRANILDLIETMFDGGTNVIVVEGQEGIGKTTLLSQFARRHPQTTVSAFVLTGNRWAYDPELIRLDIAHQLHWMVNQEELHSRNRITDDQLRTYYRKLSSQWRFKDTQITFLLDGLDNIPPEDYGTLRILLDIFPFGRNEFRFLLGGGSDVITTEGHLAFTPKSYPLAPFNADATKRFFSNSDLTQQVIIELHRTFGGVPGHLAAVKRALDSGLSAKEILASPEREVVALFDSEWEQVGDSDDKLRLALAAVAFLSPAWTIDDLAELLVVDKPQLHTRLSDLTFIAINDASRVRFVSEPFRKYSQEKLAGLEKQVRQRRIDQLLERDDQTQSFKYLPELYLDAGRYEDLLQYLDPETLNQMVPRVSSAGVLRAKAKIGLRGALELGRDGELFRFSLERSLVSELAGVDVWDSEVEARMALGKDDSARALADRVSLTEDRLHVLAIIARVANQQGTDPNPQLLDEIRHLYDEVDPKTLSNRATEIAAELVHSCPELALDLVEQTANLADSENALDTALAALSVSAVQGGDDSSDEQSLTESIRSRIKNPGLRHLADGASLLFGDSSARDVINTVDSFDDTDEALFLVRQWLSINSNRSDASDLLEYGLDRMIKASTYSPSARVYRELAHALPAIHSEDHKKRLVSKFDGQKRSVRDIGPTLEFVRFQCLVAKAESHYNLDGAVYRLLDLYYDIIEIEDVTQKLAAVGQLKVTLDDLHPGHGYLGTDLELHSELTAHFHTAFSSILDASAHQYEAVKPAISIVSEADVELAADMASKLNTQTRRDQCRLLICRSAVRQPASDVDLVNVLAVIDAMQSRPLADKAVAEVLRRIYYHREFAPEQIRPIQQLVERTESILDAETRARVCCYWLGIVSRYEPLDAGLTDHFQSVLKEAWKSIDARWTQVEVGIKITALLAEHSPEVAEWYFDKSTDLREQPSLNASAHGSVYLVLLDLVARAFHGLVEAGLHRQADFRRIESLMDSVQGSGVRAALWGDIALRVHLAEDRVLCEQIVSKHLKPLLDDIERQHQGLYYRILADAAPSLYVAHRTSALQAIDQLPSEFKDSALLRIANVLSYDCLPAEPHKDVPSDPPDLDPEDIVDLLDLSKRMTVDGNTASLIWRIARVARKTQRLTRRRRGDIAQSIREIAQDKFPDPDNIEHEGYLITALASAAAVDRAPASEWADLRQRAISISNDADRAFVLGFIASVMQPRGGERRKTFKQAREAVREIPTEYDRVSRLLDLAKWAAAFKEQWAKQCIEEAMKGTSNVDHDEVEDIHKRAIDLAHQIDPDFASGLTEFVDPDRINTGADFDARRAKMRAHLSRQIRIRDVRQEVVDDRHALQGAKRQDLSGSGKETLASVNAGRFVLFEKERIHSLLSDLARYGLRDVSYWYASLIEMITKKYAHTDQAAQIIRPIFEQLCFATEFCKALVARNNEGAVGLPEADNDIDSGIVIREGEREEAIRNIRNWLRTDVSGSLVISDPYFGPESLEALRLIQSETSDPTVRILTSRRHHDQEVDAPWNMSYQQAWRVFSDVKDPPETELVIVGAKSSGKAPIHDRWWLSSHGGLKMGTSFRSLGKSGDSDLSVMSAQEATQKLAQVQRYLDARKRIYNGERLSYTTILLP